MKARAELDFDFYHATKHYGVHYMWTVLKLSPRAIAAIAGWKSGTVMSMLETYGHADAGAFEGGRRCVYQKSKDASSNASLIGPTFGVALFGRYRPASMAR